MANDHDLKRFTDTQEADYPIALAEIRTGRKRSHWIWYIFPQIQGLGFSEISKYYAIKNRSEAGAYLKQPVLGKRLIEISNELLRLKSSNANAIFGSPDDLKLRSSMTLFAEITDTDRVFELVLDKFFNGEKDSKTLQLLN